MWPLGQFVQLQIFQLNGLVTFEYLVWLKKPLLLASKNCDATRQKWGLTSKHSPHCSIQGRLYKYLCTNVVIVKSAFSWLHSVFLALILSTHYLARFPRKWYIGHIFWHSAFLEFLHWWRREYILSSWINSYKVHTTCIEVEKRP